MSRLFILGAGASVAHSNGLMPHAGNFLQKARDIGFFSNLYLGEKEELAQPPYLSTEILVGRFYGLWKEKQDDIDAVNKINIEELLTLTTLQLQIEPTFTSTEDIAKLIVDTIDYYSQKCKKRNGPYDLFIKEVITDSDNIFTFNWDTLLDQKLPDFFPSENELSYYSSKRYRNYIDTCTAECEGFIDTLGAGHPYIPNTPETNCDEKNSGILAEPIFLKLHGSVDLVYCVNSSCENHQKPFKTKGTIKQKNNCGKCHEKVQRYIIPPVLIKPIRDLPYIRRTWNLAQQLCETATEVVFWGYSLPPTDYWANWLIRKVWQGKCKKITIINPEVIGSDNKLNENFVKRFCPSRQFAGKKIESEAFKDFNDYLKSIN